MEKSTKDKKQTKKDFEKEFKSLGWDEKVKALVDKGFKKNKKLYKTLQECSGDVVKCETQMKEEKEKKIKRKAEKKEEKEKIFKALFPEEKEVDFKKIKGFKKEFKKNPQDSKMMEKMDLLRKIKDEKKEKKYFALFPEDKTVDWKKYTQEKRACKTKKSKEEKEFSKQEKLNKKKEKFFKIFPNEEFNWKKYREAKKEEKSKNKKERSEKKLIKNAEKEEREKHQIEEWKNSIENLYLDGNNMFHVDPILRGKCIKGVAKGAESNIFELAKAFALKIGAKNLVLVFDKTKTCYEGTQDDLQFKVCSASPEHQSSDDALVVWVGGMSASVKENSLVVTSDRALQTRLIQKGLVNTMKSGKFFAIAKETLGEDIYTKILAN